jgi:hypothetical protein
MKLPAVSLLVLIITDVCLLTLVPTVLADNHGIHDDPSLRLRRNDKECPDGFGGTNCEDEIDECKGSPYPCAGGTKHGSFCVDYNPPKKFKCGCLPGFDAVLPNTMEVKDPVPVEWRPLKCVPRDVCVDVVATRTPPALYLLPTWQFAFATTTLSEMVSPIALLPPRRRHEHNCQLVMLILTVTSSRILFVWMVCANARPVFTKAMGKASVSMKMNVRMVTPTTATRMRFAPTRKGATRVRARMGIKT